MKNKFTILNRLIASFLVLVFSSHAIGSDIGDYTFDIFSEGERKAFKEFDLSSELKEADRQASANNFDAAIEICRKLLKNTDLSLADRKKAREKISSIEGKRSEYLAAKAREEEDKKKAEAGSLLEEARIGSEQERQRLLNSTGYMGFS